MWGSFSARAGMQWWEHVRTAAYETGLAAVRDGPQEHNTIMWARETAYQAIGYRIEACTTNNYSHKQFSLEDVDEILYDAMVTCLSNADQLRTRLLHQVSDAPDRVEGTPWGIEGYAIGQTAAELAQATLTAEGYRLAMNHLPMVWKAENCAQIKRDIDDIILVEDH